MRQEDLYRMIDEKERGLDMSVAFPALMRKVYTWMTLALVITGVTAYGVANSPGLLQAIYSSKLTFFGLIAAELGIVIYTSARIHKLALSTATLLFALFSVINGATLASVFIVYSQAAITKTFLVTAGTFAAMAFIGSTTKRDLTKMGGILMMALIGLLVCIVVNIFLASSRLDWIISIVGVGIFIGLTAWDTQKIKHMVAYADTPEALSKVSTLGALSLYLDFINLFLYLLRFFGGRD